MRMLCRSVILMIRYMHKEDYDSLTPLERQAALLEYAVLDDDAEKILEKQGRL